MRNLLCTMLLLSLASCASLLPAPTGTHTPSEPNNLAQRIWMPNGHPDQFAVIIAGDAELRHQGNVAVAYQTLIELGHRRQNIIILSEGEKDTPWFPWTDEPTKASVKMALERMALAVEPHDTIVVYLTGHGDKSLIDHVDETGKTTTYNFSTFKLNPSENLTRDEFKELLEAIKPKFGILMMDQCYWGVFERLPCEWSQFAATQNSVLSHNTTFGRTFWREFAKPDVSSVQSFERAAAASPKDHPTTKVCVNDIPETEPLPDLEVPTL